MSRHIIHKEHVIVKTSTPEQAQVIQKMVSGFSKNGLLKIIEDIFDEFSDENEILRIDSLNLDLGTIDAAGFENSFKERLTEKLRAAIPEKRNNAGENNSGTTVIRIQQSLWDALIYFLQFGTKPWYHAVKKTADWEASIMQAFTKFDWQKTISRLKENYIQEPVIIKRLASQFSEDFLIKILQELTSERVDWKTIHADILLLFDTSPASKNSLEVSGQVWEKILLTFLDEQEIIIGLTGIVKNIAESLNISQEEIIKRLDVESRDHEGLENIFRSEELRAAIVELINESGNDQKGNRGNDNKEQLSTDGINESKEITKATVLEDDIDKDSPVGQVNKNDTPLENKKNNHADKKKKTEAVLSSEAQYVINCGVILLHPFLEMYFKEFDLLHERKFTDINSCKRAVLLLHYLATGHTQVAEFDLLLQKLLCNLPLEETLPNEIELTEKEKSESLQLLQSVINYWPPLKNTSAEGLRNTFLQREGKIEMKENGWLLTVEQKAFDILLEKLPWGFSTIQLPWMNNIISVDWC